MTARRLSGRQRAPELARGDLTAEKPTEKLPGEGLTPFPVSISINPNPQQEKTDMLAIKTQAALDAASIPPSWKAALAERLGAEPFIDDDPGRDGCVVIVIEAGDETAPLPGWLNLYPPGARLADLLRAMNPAETVAPEEWPSVFEWVDALEPSVFLGFVLRGNDYGYLFLIHAAEPAFDPATAALLREAAGKPASAQG